MVNNLLLSILKLIEEKEIETLKNLYYDEQLFQSLKKLGLITNISSNISSELNFELTKLGKQIIELQIKSGKDLKNDSNTVVEILDKHEKILFNVLDDLQKIKSVLGSYSLDIMRGEGTNFQETQGLITRRQGENFKVNQSSIDKANLNDKKDNTLSNGSSFDNLLDYYSELRGELNSETLKKVKFIINKINRDYSNLKKILKEKDYEGVGLELFLILDSILNIILIFNFEDYNTSHLSQNLVSKYTLINKFLPFTIHLDLLHFLDEIKIDLDSSKNEIKLGEKTSTKIFKSIQSIINDFNLFIDKIFNKTYTND